MFQSISIRRCARLSVCLAVGLSMTPYQKHVPVALYVHDLSFLINANPCHRDYGLGAPLWTMCALVWMIWMACLRGQITYSQVCSHKTSTNDAHYDDLWYLLVVCKPVTSQRQEINTQTCTHMNTHIWTHTHTRTHAHTPTHTHTHTHTRTHTNVHTYSVVYWKWSIKCLNAYHLLQYNVAAQRLNSYHLLQ